MSNNKELILPLSECVQEMIGKYFSNMDKIEPSNLYQLILQEIEMPLFNAVMKHTGGNLSKAATILGVNRGTLRKKLKEYKENN